MCLAWLAGTASCCPAFPITSPSAINRREQTFFEDGDYALYLDLLADAAGRAGVEIWSCCLMPNQKLRCSLLNVPDNARK